MQGANKEQLAAAVRKKIAQPVYAMLVGDHLTGIVAQETAYTIAGAMLVPVRGLLGLRPVREIKERQVEVEGWSARLCFADLKAALDAVASTRNTAALEELFSPHAIFGGAELDKVRSVARGFVTKAAYHDIMERMAPHRAAVVEGGPVAEALEAARILLFGTHLLSSGELRSHLDSLAPERDEGWLDALRRRNRGEGVGALLTAEEAKQARHGLAPMEDRLGMALTTSELPEAGGSVSALDEFLVELRLRELREGL